MRTISFNVYKIDEHPEPELCYEYIRNNWHDLGQYCIDEMIKSLEALSKHVNGELDYSISIYPDRGEFVEIKNFDKYKLEELYNIKGDCPLTGVCYDYEVISGLYNGRLSHDVLETLHNEGEYIYSNKGLKELCENNEYEFYANGKLV